MKVYITVECGYEHTTILDVFARYEDAIQLANSHDSILKQEWAELYKEGSKYHSKEMLKNGPHDKTHVLTYEVKGAKPLPLLPSPLTAKELEWAKEQQKIDAEPDEE